MTDMPPLRTANSVKVLGRVKASLAALAAGRGLDSASALHTEAFIEAAGDLEDGRRENTND